MSSNKREIEARGPDVEKAIAAGLAQLGLGRNDVIIEIVDEGSRGLLGIGSRDAVVRLTSMVTTPAPKEQPVEKVTEAEPIDLEESLQEEQQIALEVINTLVQKMHVKANVSAALSAPDDLSGEQLNLIQINGNDLGILIGPRGETLSAIQYISRLMVAHRLRRRAYFIVDVEGYRQRREQALARLAERMARKVIKRRRPVGLEPMPPHERRIIHMTLRDHEAVYTQSVGEGNRRKVRILPK